MGTRRSNDIDKSFIEHIKCFYGKEQMINGFMCVYVVSIALIVLRGRKTNKTQKIMFQCLLMLVNEETCNDKP